MEKKKFKLGLLPKLLIAIVLGIIIGQFFPVWFCRDQVIDLYHQLFHLKR